MKKKLTFLLYTCILIKVHSQGLKTADSFFYAGDYQAAITLYNKVVSEKKVLLPIDLGNAYLRQGISYSKIQQPQNALTNYFSALDIFEKLANKERISAACVNIANIYYGLENIISAEKYFRQAYNLSVQLNDSPRIAMLLSNLAMIKFKEPDKREAIQLHLFAINNYSNVMDEELLCRHSLNLANCFAEIRNDSAILFYTKAEELASSLEDSMLLLKVYLNKGDAYKQQSNYSKALDYLNKSLALNKEYGDSIDLSVLYRNLADTYDSLKQYDKAYYYSKKEIELNEALYNTEKSKFSAELSEKYESGKKDEKIKSQETENKLKSRNLLLSFTGLALVAALAVISFINYKRKQKANVVLQLQNDRIEKLNKELDASNQVKSKLFSVISHDIRGPISSIYAYLQMQNMAAKNDTNTAFSSQTEQLLETLEDLLVWSKSQLHQFTPSAENVFLQPAIVQITSLLQSTINEKKLLVKNEVPDNFVLNTDINMLTILLRNLLSNAVKYSLPGTEIKIVADKIKYNNTISIINQTDAATASSLQNFETPVINSNASGLGLTLIKEFAGKLGGTVQYNQSGNIITALLSLPAA